MGDSNIFKRLNLSGLIGFCISACFALYEKWSMPEFCWSFWLSGVFYCWFLVLAGCIRIILSPRLKEQAALSKMPLFQKLNPLQIQGLLILTCLGVCYAAFYLYTWVFGFYGTFLSVFAEMEPLKYFGRNGFINSDFFTPMTYLLHLFWPMVIGTIASDVKYVFTENPWKIVFKPFSSRLIMVHIMVVGVPIISLLTWAIFRESYQPVTIIILLAIFSFMPRDKKPPGPKDATFLSQSKG
ncbi:MAG: hypothetical protein SGI98_08140 [Verrucomicrobiota bacterium]|nr:hypothetical protein [Verrucomicrobiota bacterium]